MATSTLRESTPSAQGVDASGIAALLDVLESAPHIEPHSIMLLRHGHVVAKGWWAPYAPEIPQLLYSLSKSFTSTAVGLAIDEGLMSLDDTVLSYFPELDAEITDPRSRRILVRHVAAMASGHLADTGAQAKELSPDNIVRGFLLIPPDEEPGSVFAYNQSCTYSLAAIIARVSGQSVTEFLKPRLFDPLGITEYGWTRGPSGHEIGYSGLHSTTDAIAKLGLLYLQRGMWNGRQLLSPSWVDAATTVQVEHAETSPIGDWQQGYGYQFWMSTHGYRGDGAYGQFCIVLPEFDVVLAITSTVIDMQSVLTAVWKHLLPAFADGPLAPSDVEAALADRLVSLTLPSVEAAPAPATESVSDWDGWTGQASDGPLSAVSARLDGQTWHVTLVGPTARDIPVALELALGTAGWLASTPVGPYGPVPVVTSGGWTDAGTLRFDVIFIETPHRLQVTCTLADRSVATKWLAPPLRENGIEQLRSPR